MLVGLTASLSVAVAPVVEPLSFLYVTVVPLTDRSNVAPIHIEMNCSSVGIAPSAAHASELTRCSTPSAISVTAVAASSDEPIALDAMELDFNPSLDTLYASPAKMLYVLADVGLVPQADLKI